MKISAYPTGRMKKFLKHNQDGATAIEFALLSIPFVFLVIGIIEIAIMFAGAALLEGATNSAARLVRTGQIKTAADPQVAFQNALCDYTVALIDCNEITFESIPLDSFMDADDMEPEYDEDGNMTSQGFDPAGSNDRVLIRVAYRYHMLTPFIGPLLAGADNSILFMSTIVLQTEPYEFEDE